MWHDRFEINWEDADNPGPTADDYDWRMKMLDGGALLFEGKQRVGPPLSGPPSSLIVGPFNWTSVRIPSIGRMATKSLISCEDSRIWLRGENTFGPVEYEMKMLAGGMLLLHEKPSEESEHDPMFLEFLVVAPHAWERVKTPSVDFLAINGSRWCHPYVWLVDKDPPPGFDSPASPSSRMRIIDGSMLLLQEEGDDREFVIVAPHAWSGVHGSFDFTQ